VTRPDQSQLPADLAAEIAQSGFYPNLVAESVELGLGGREVLSV